VMYKAANKRPDCGLVIGAVPVSDPDPVADPANLSVLVPDCLFFFAFYLFVAVFKHVRGHPSGPKISRSHPDCLLVTSSGRKPP